MTPKSPEAPTQIRPDSGNMQWTEIALGREGSHLSYDVLHPGVGLSFTLFFGTSSLRPETPFLGRTRPRRFLVTANDRYITHADFLAFIGRAAKYEGFEGDDPVHAWLRTHKYHTELKQPTLRRSATQSRPLRPRSSNIHPEAVTANPGAPLRARTPVTDDATREGANLP